MPETVSPSLEVALGVMFPGGTPATDLRVLGWEGAVPDLSQLSPGEVVTLQVGVANSHPSQAYRIVGANLRQKAAPEGGVNVAKDVSATKDIPAGSAKTVVPVQVTVLDIDSGLRGQQAGAYRLELLGDLPA